MPNLNCDPVSSVWRAGPQPQSFEFSVACRNRGDDKPFWQIGPGTRVPLQGAVDVVHCWIRRDSVSSVWHAGPQLRSCEFSVACWTPTPILRVQWRAGPQPRGRRTILADWPWHQGAIARCSGRSTLLDSSRFCEFSVACRTSTAIL